MLAIIKKLMQLEMLAKGGRVEVHKLSVSLYLVLAIPQLQKNHNGV
jgi:hypothetical protein